MSYTLYWQHSDEEINSIPCDNESEAYDGMRTLEEDFRDYDDVNIWYSEDASQAT